MNDQTPTKSLLSWKEKAGYAVGDTASCLYWQTFSQFLMIFYTDVFGISAAAVGVMLMVTRFIDAGSDPIVGVLADRTQTRWGKFRPWLLWGIVPFAITGVLLFVTPDLSPAGKLVYAYVTYNLVMIAYTIVNVPYGALLGVISPNSEDRTKLASYRFVGAFAGNIIVQGTLLYLVSGLGQGNQQLGYPLAMSVYAVLAGILFYFTFATSRERVMPTAKSNSVRKDLWDLCRNRPWVVLCLMNVATLIYVSMRNVATLYYFKYYMGSEKAAAPFMVLGTVFSIVGALLAPYLNRWIGSKRKTFIVLTLICSASFLLFALAKPGEYGVLYAAHIIQSICNAAMMPLVWSMYADTADYGEWKFGRRSTGLVFSAGTFSQKMGGALAGGLTGLLLDRIGFIPNQAQTEGALLGIRNMMSVYPAALTCLAIGLALAYNLNAKKEQEMRAFLAARTAKDPSTA